jgi:hypothetical protein
MPAITIVPPVVVIVMNVIDATAFGTQQADPEGQQTSQNN